MTMIKTQAQASHTTTLNQAYVEALTLASEQAGLCGALFNATAGAKAFKAEVMALLIDAGYFKAKKPETKTKALDTTLRAIYAGYKAGNEALIQTAKVAAQHHGLKGADVTDLTSKATEKMRSNFSYFFTKSSFATELGLKVSFKSDGSGDYTLTEIKAKTPTSKRTPKQNQGEPHESPASEQSEPSEAPAVTKREKADLLSQLSRAELAHLLLESVQNNPEALAKVLAGECAKSKVTVQEVMRAFIPSLPDTIQCELVFSKKQAKTVTRKAG